MKAIPDLREAMPTATRAWVDYAQSRAVVRACLDQVEETARTWLEERKKCLIDKLGLENFLPIADVNLCSRLVAEAVSLGHASVRVRCGQTPVFQNQTWAFCALSIQKTCFKAIL